MKATIVGYKNIDYVNDKNQRVKGLRIYYTFPDASVDVGVMVGQEYFTEAQINKFPDLVSLSLGDVYLLDYSKGTKEMPSRLLYAELLKSASGAKPVERNSGTFGK